MKKRSKFFFKWISVSPRINLWLSPKQKCNEEERQIIRSGFFFKWISYLEADSRFQHNWGARLTKAKKWKWKLYEEDLGCDLVLWRIGIVSKFLEFWRGLRRVLSTIVQNGEKNKNNAKILCVVFVCVQWRRVKRKDEHQLRGKISIHHQERDWEGWWYLSLYVCEHIYIYSYSASFKNLNEPKQLSNW